MSERKSASFDDRLAVLEHQVRRLTSRTRLWRRMAVAGGLCAAALCAAGARGVRVPDELEAGQFVLRDADGNVRARLHAPDQKGVDLSLFDTNQKPRLSIGLDAKGSPELYFRDKDQKGLVSLTAGTGGTSPVVHLKDGRGERIVFGFDAEGDPSLVFCESADADVRVSLTYCKGVAQLGIFGKNGEHDPIVLSVDPDGAPNLIMHGKDGKVLFQMPKPD
jgi:hypothetical protein